MKQRSKRPFVPSERHETLRLQIMDILSEGTFSAKELSAEVKIPEKEVYEHLEHIQRTMDRKDRRLIVMPAECKKCGFVFAKRERLTKSGRCPVCKSESIHEPVFSIDGVEK